MFSVLKMHNAKGMMEFLHLIYVVYNLCNF
jgi:hypothetical protein